MFTAAQVAAGGTPTATVERKDIPSPQGLAFDSSGNLWVAAQDVPGIMRIDAAHLTATGSGADLAITAMDAASFGTLSSPMGSPSTELETLGELRWDHREHSGRRADWNREQDDYAARRDHDRRLTLPVGIAFDQDGGLWFAHAVNKFARLDATQLGTSGAVTPSIVITSDDVGSAAWFAMYPAPPFTPLYHKVP